MLPNNIIHKAGEVYSIIKENEPVPGCTISEMVYNDAYHITNFSLAKGTSISAESYPHNTLYIILSGDVMMNDQHLTSMDALITPKNELYGLKAIENTIYTEINLKETIMNNLTPGQIFSLKNILPFKEGKIVNMDIVDEEKMKFVVMSFDAGCSLPEHAAPGQALIFALEGEGIIGYEGQEYPLKEGENFVFAPGGMHYVKAEKPFKMALLLLLK